jgi:hypothetical protein
VVVISRHRVARLEYWRIDGLDAVAGGGQLADGWGCAAVGAAMAGTKTSGTGGLYPSDPC